ncbi:MAG: hypothetical protein CML04_01325 [Pseudozobellia sp.]|mgnify:CR=1 FL=1|nr:hypothetical protein [Pseudozobellia sp.]
MQKLNLKKLLSITILIISSIQLSAQMNEDLGFLTFSFSPLGIDNIEYRSTDMGGSIPMRIQKGVLINSLNYSFTNIKVDDPNLEYSASELENIHSLSYALSYIHPLENNWKLLGRGGVMAVSNFSTALTADDLFLNGTLLLIKRLQKAEKLSVLSFGGGYATLAGKPMFFPYINYFKQSSRHWSYSLGFPQAFLRYHFSPHTRLSLNASINGLYANLSKPIVVDVVGLNETAKKLSFRTGLLGIEYQNQLGKYWNLFLKAEYAFWGDYILEDNFENDIFKQDVSKGLYFTTGIKLNVLRNKTRGAKPRTESN